MSFAAERAVIESTFSQNWSVSSFAGIPVQYENTPLKDTSGAYLHLRIISGTGRTVEITGSSTSFSRYSGIVQIDVVVPQETGTASARSMADVVASIFRRKQITDPAAGRLVFRVPMLRQVGPVLGRYRFIVSIPFQRDIRE